MSSSKVAVVVGVGPGLGAAVSRRFASEGFSVGLMARTAAACEAVQRQIEEAGGRALSVPADAADADSVAAAFARVNEALGPVDVLIYNASAFRVAGALEITPRELEDDWKISCLGGFLSAQAVLPGMLERGQGTILFTGATASLRGGARFAALAVGKFGLRALAQSLARELGPRGVHVAHVVIDGLIDTPRVRAMLPGRNPQTMLSPEALAETYFQLHAQPPSAWTHEIDVRPSVERF
ncbi:short-chain dehydrogenase [Sorangium cellulosum]|uniref:Short-chain dehydrogenase n=1 Tax=Sorangium cellulosum TaxID=56 RepID=A0A2L0EII3_SORCE|nr:SDR family NAD(P)-dependent oxidoreductase [Sorangium cellulosum]AUX39098.1 short-chain dehydrogenase [Sorangium cellulosum]